MRTLTDAWSPQHADAHEAGDTYLSGHGGQIPNAADDGPTGHHSQQVCHHAVLAAVPEGVTKLRVILQEERRQGLRNDTAAQCSAGDRSTVQGGIHIRRTPSPRKHCSSGPKPWGSDLQPHSWLPQDEHAVREDFLDHHTQIAPASDSLALIGTPKTDAGQHPATHVLASACPVSGGLCSTRLHATMDV